MLAILGVIAILTAAVGRSVSGVALDSMERLLASGLVAGWIGTVLSAHTTVERFRSKNYPDWESLLSAATAQGDEREAVGEVVAVAGNQPHAASVAAGHDAEAIVLYLVDPAGTGWRLLCRAGKT